MFHVRARRPLGGGTMALCVCLCACVWAPAASAGVTGVCPDGSIFIVQTRAQIPCTGAKIVEPSKVPPLRPENLPRPYLWEVYRERADTTRNPYHLLESAEQVRQASPGSDPNAAPSGPSGQGADPQHARISRSRPADPQPAELGLSDGEVRDLFMLVELSQRQVPVSFIEGVPGREEIRVSFAHSHAFVDRALEAGLLPPTSVSPVLLFSAVATRESEFHPNFTLVQGHIAFQPDLRDQGQMGLLRGALGRQEPGAVVLGYLVLPEDFALEAPLDVYWNDRRIEAPRFLP